MKTSSRIGLCKIKGCDGTVGKLLPIFLENAIDDDGKVCQVILAYPCDKCGALYGASEAQGIIEDEDGNNVFSQRGALVFKDNQGRLVRKDGSHILR